MPLESLLVGAGKKGAQELAKRLLGLEDRVVALDAKVDALRQGELYSGMQWLEEASTANSRRDAEIALNKARDRFVDAQGPLRGDGLRQAYASLAVALIDHLEGRPAGARKWSARAHEQASAAARDNAARLTKLVGAPDRLTDPDRLIGKLVPFVLGGAAAVVVVPIVGSLIAALPIVLVGLLIATGVFKWSSRKAAVRYKAPAIAELKAASDFVTEIGEVRKRLGEDPVKVPEFELIVAPQLMLFREVKWQPGAVGVRVIGVSDDDEAADKRERVLRLGNATLEMLGEPARLTDADVEVMASDPNPYGVADRDTIAAIRLFARTEGLIADPVYEGKAIRGLIELIERGRIRRSDRVLLMRLGGTHAVHAYANQLWDGDSEHALVADRSADQG